MANKILVARGTKARIEEIKSTLATNELVYSTDTGELGVKKADGNIEYFMNATDINAKVDPNAMAYFDYAGSFYGDNYSLLANAWQDMKDSETVLFDIPLELAAANQEMGGKTVDLYVGTDGQLQALYDACVNETIPPPQGDPMDLLDCDVYYVNNVATPYMGDASDTAGFPIPLYLFGHFQLGIDDSTLFLVADLTPLSMGLGITLIKFATVSIPNNNIVIQQGFEFENESGIIIPNNVTSIGSSAFFNWKSNNQPLVIPNSVTSIGSSAFRYWKSNNQPLIIPNSVTSIGNYAFWGWITNNQPLVIPDSVTSIGVNAFDNWSLVPYIEILATTPPTLASSNAFANQNNAPIYVPDESVDNYKTATNWVDLASRIFPISDKADLMDDIADLQENKQDKLVAGDNITIEDNVISASVAWQDVENKPELYNKAEIDLMLGDIESALDAILGV